MKRKAAFFDIDGTLTSEIDGSIPESVFRSVRQARENGNLMFINTGRCFSYLEDRFKDIGFDGYICGCGTNIFTSENGKMTELLHVSQDHTMAELLLKLAERFRLDLLFEGKNGMSFKDPECLITKGAEKMFREFTELGLDVSRDVTASDFSFDKFVVWFSDHDDIQDFCTVSDRYFTCIDRGGNFREFVPAGYSKASGIRTAAGYYGFELADSYAFGDSCNDLPMLLCVPNSVAMGNARPETLFESVSYRADRASCDGIEKALRHFGFI